MVPGRSATPTRPAARRDGRRGSNSFSPQGAHIYPVLFRIDSFGVTSFGALVAVGALVGLWLFRHELRRSGLPGNAVDAGYAGIIGGLLGAKLLWVAEHLGEEPVADLVLSRGGMSWFGGLAGGLIGGLWILHQYRLTVLATLSAATPGLAVGHAIGRIGCFMVGDDYGRPSTLPWAVAFPDGLPPTTVPVHPTQLYEAAALLPIAWLLIKWRNEGLDDHVVVGRYFMIVGLLRFLIEFVRVNRRVIGPLTVAHLASLLAVAVGLGVLAARKRARV